MEDGWTINGSKVWTSGAHHAHAVIALVRTSPFDPADRHAGLSQFLIELTAHGVQVRPIISMNGAHHFNEVVLTDVFVPDAQVFGTIGRGWMQVTSELSFERSGPERFLSTFPLLADLTARDENPDLGRLVGRIAGLHHMAAAVAGALERREPADVAAAVLKVLGTSTEGDIVESASLLTGDELPSSRPWQELVNAGLDQRPGFTLRGGTSEVLRGVIARELGLR